METTGAQSIISKFDLTIHPLAEFNKVFIQTESVGRLTRHKAYQFSIDRCWREAGIAGTPTPANLVTASSN
jgi:hypothetical protein